MLLVATTMSAQTFVKGDMNDDGEVNVADVTSVVNVAVGKSPVETLSIDPYGVNNSSVEGTWYGPNGLRFELRDDATTDYPGSSFYEYMPSLGRLLFLDGSGNAVKGLGVWGVSDFRLLLMDYATGVISPYYTSMGLPSELTLSDHSLNINVGGTAQLTATVFPPMTSGFYTWSSDDTSVATVDQNGVVTAVGSGTCTITCASAYNPELKDYCSVSVKQMATSITLNHQLCNLNRNGYITLQATVLPADADQSVTWTSSNDNVVEVSSDGQVYAKNFGSCIVTCTANDGSGVSATCYIYVTESVRSSVDLGLPSGTLWAICNVGANGSAAYGDYFAWGETTTKSSSYWWDNYRYGSVYALTKYCQDGGSGANGFTDNLTELVPGDDAATANWGSDWCTPTINQCNELINSNYTTVTWTTMEGVNGRLITSKSNGNFLFLPAGGRYETQIFSRGEIGYYWSRSLLTNGPNMAYVLYFESGRYFQTFFNRCIGHSVRPVRVSQ